MDKQIQLIIAKFNKYKSLDFDDWCSLHQASPALFEDLRKNYIKQQLDKFPAEQRRYAVSFQKIIDGELENADDRLKRLNEMIEENLNKISEINKLLHTKLK